MTSPNPLIGEWQMVRAELAGEAAPDLVAEHTVLAFTAASYSVRFQGRETDRGWYEIGGAVDKSTIVLRGHSGPNAGRTIPAIFQLRGNRLRICYGMNGVAPTEFTTTEANQQYAATYRRATAGDDL